jgi:methionyl-tRNA synthetase
MQFGYHCEECEEAIWPAQSRAELAWLRDRKHVAREVANHVSGGLDHWMMEGLEFLERHLGHSVIIARKVER